MKLNNSNRKEKEGKGKDSIHEWFGGKKILVLNKFLVMTNRIEFDELIYRRNQNFTKQSIVYFELQNKLRIISEKKQQK